LATTASGSVLGDRGRIVVDVVHDSRQASPSTLFVAIRGFERDGHGFAPVAAEAGAALCLDHRLDLEADQLIVEDTRAAIGPLASEVHDHPSLRLALVGVTGTNGKTMVTHLVEAIADAAGRRSGLVGTIEARIGGHSVDIARTTPEASDFQRLLAQMVGAGVELATVEVSSHALALGRVAGSRFKVAAFTNLSQDHLDFHGAMDDYFAAKTQLFQPDLADEAVVWTDDPWGERLLALTPLPVTTVGRDKGDVRAANIETSLRGSRFELRTAGGSRRVDLRLGGAFNVANALVAAACCLQLGLNLDAVAEGLQRVEGVPGRFQILDLPKSSIIVDYAHTPDGIAAAIRTVRDAAKGRVVVVFGAGGDRDREKRSLMGTAASQADLVVVTSDNPRSESPEAIIEEVVAGVEGDVMTEIDRRLAIRLAIAEAGADDVVLILGKGHEQGQEFADRTDPFDDVRVAHEEAVQA
jgi:UDP-N-acetylmuramoyl-L-alanyl-D-glutamate--2,6-diaminopimelate ligase